MDKLDLILQKMDVMYRQSRQFSQYSMEAFMEQELIRLSYELDQIKRKCRHCPYNLENTNCSI